MTAGRLRKWTISVVATAASTYALDAVATAAGVYLVASGAFRGWVTTGLWSCSWRVT
jgi:hypothetical protein